MKFRVTSRARDERGVTALIVALLSTILFAFAALAVDISTLSFERQKLHDHIDSAAHAGAYELPGNSSAAVTAATNMVTSQDATVDPGVDVFCVIGSTGATKKPNMDQVPSTCTPGGAVSPATPPWTCNTVLCSIPCTRSDAKCNTVKVQGDKPVPYGFARILGINQGNTGSVSSAACKGSCGTESPNPLDIVVVADRTPSMYPNLPDLRSSIRTMIATMDPTMQFLALGTIDAAAAKPTTAALLPNTSCPNVANANQRSRPNPGGTPTWTDMQKGSWMATQFSNTYSTKVGETFVLNDRDRVTNAVTCLEFSPLSQSSVYRTHLAAPLRAAVQNLWDESGTNLRALSTAANRPGELRKVVIFETDGAPLERLSQTGNTNISTIDSMGVNEPRNETEWRACNNLKAVADAAKAKGTLIITVGFGDAATENCGSSRISTVLADVATDSDNPQGCRTPATRKQENEDGDYFFCATSGSELASIFSTAFEQLQTGIKLIRLP